MMSLLKAIIYLIIVGSASGQDALESGFADPSDPQFQSRIASSSDLVAPSIETTTIEIPNLRSDSGQVRSDESTRSSLYVGFSGDANSATFLSFDISRIPEDAYISDVDLEFTGWDIIGDPFSSLGCLNIYPASYDSLRSLTYSSRSASSYARICNQYQLNSKISSPALLNALRSSLGRDRFQLRLQFDREIEISEQPARPSESEPEPSDGDAEPSAPGPILNGILANLSSASFREQLAESRVLSGGLGQSPSQYDIREIGDASSSGYMLLTPDLDLSRIGLGITPDDIKRAVKPGQVRIAQEEGERCTFNDRSGVWRYDGEILYCDITYPSMGCPSGQMVDSSSGICCPDSNNNEICDYKESHQIVIGSALLVVSYSLIPQPPNIPPDGFPPTPDLPDDFPPTGPGQPLPDQPPVERDLPDLGVGYFKPPRVSSLIDTTSIGWGEVPANQVLVTIDSRLGFEDAREAARELASDLGGEVVGEFQYLNLFQIETDSETLEELEDDIDFARDYDLADLAFPNQQVYREPHLSNLSYQGEWGRGYKIIGVEGAWDAIYNASINLSNVFVGLTDDGIYTGRGQFNNTDINISLELYPDNPLNLLSSPRTGFEIPGSHGTGVTSILTANPLSGLVGVAYNPLSEEGKLRVYMVNIFDENDRSFVTTSLLGFKREIEGGSTILSCSWGNSEADEETVLLYEDFLTKLLNDYPDLLFICSAGNDGMAIDGRRRIPNGIPNILLRGGSLPNLVTVGNIFNNGTISPSSNKNRNNNYVTLAAPGEEAVWGIYDNGTLFNYGGGTSMAVPQVTAAAAFVRSINPLLNASEIKDILVNTALYDIDGSTVPKELGGIAIYIDRAVKKAIYERPPNIDINIPVRPTPDIPIPGGLSSDSSGVLDGDGNGILDSDNASGQTAGFASVTVQSATSKGFSVIVDGNIVGKDGIGGDAFDGVYTFKVSGDQPHVIKAASQFNQMEWPAEFFRSLGSYIYEF